MSPASAAKLWTTRRRATVTAVEEEWARALGAEDLEQLRTRLLRLATIVAKHHPEPG